MWSKDFVKDVFSNMGVYSTERVIQEVDVTVLIHSPCQTHSLFLTSTQVDALKRKSSGSIFLLSSTNWVPSLQSQSRLLLGESLDQDQEHKH